MTTNELISLCISALSLLVAGVAAFRTYALGQFQLRVATRNEFQKLLLEINRELVRDPELWGVYDSHPMSRVKQDDPAHRVKLESFAYMVLHVFQIVVAYREDAGRLSPGDQVILRAWDGLCRDMVNDSRIARDILARPTTSHIYDPRFLAFVLAMADPKRAGPVSSVAAPQSV